MNEKEEAAKKVAERIIAGEPFTIYQTRRNRDMTEGRGPMVNDKTFLFKQDANDYIDSQKGVMGREARWSQQRHGDWDVVEVEVDTLSKADWEEIRNRERKRIEQALHDADISDDDIRLYLEG